MTDEQKRSGWTEAALSAVIAWFPDLPRLVKATFASATIYLVLCLVAQVSPVALFQAGRNEFREWVQESRQAAAENRAAVAKERADMILLLREQLSDARSQARPGADPVLASKVERLDRDLRRLQWQLDVLLDEHPKARAGARAPPE